jgi:hypothetical protein
MLQYNPTVTGSLQVSGDITGTVNGINITGLSQSVSTQLISVQVSTGSSDAKFETLSGVTSSALTRLTNIETKSASVDISISNINSITASNIARLSNLETKSSSVDISLSNINSKTGSYATTGSNSFYGTQVFSGSVYIANDLGQITYLGNGTSGLYVWGAQLEQGSYPTSYIPTTSASVTRNADVISKTGISSLIGQTEGTLFVDVDFTHNNKGQNEYLAQVWVDSANRILLYRSTNGRIAAYLLRSSSAIYNFESLIDTNGKHKIAFAYKSGDIVFYIDGVAVNSSTSTFTAFSSMSNYDLGIHTAGGSPAEIGDYPYSSAALWKTRLTNTQLAELTTL